MCIGQGSQSGGKLPFGVHFTYPGCKFDDTVAHLSTALVSKEKTVGKFYVRKLPRGNWEKKGREPRV